MTKLIIPLSSTGGIQQFIYRHFDHFYKVDIGDKVHSPLLAWCRANMGEDGCVYYSSKLESTGFFELSFDTEARWTYTGSIYFFRCEEDSILFKLTNL